MIHSIMQVLESEASTIEEAPLGGKVWYPTGLHPSVQTIYDGHSHLNRWSVEVGREDRGPGA